MSDQGFPAASQIPAGSVVITPVQMYEEMRATHEVVTRIEAALNPLPAILADHEKQLDLLRGLPDVAADHEARLRLLERFQWKAVGIASTIATLVGVSAGYVTSQIK